LRAPDPTIGSRRVRRVPRHAEGHRRHLDVRRRPGPRALPAPAEPDGCDVRVGAPCLVPHGYALPPVDPGAARAGLRRDASTRWPLRARIQLPLGAEGAPVRGALQFPA